MWRGQALGHRIAQGVRATLAFGLGLGLLMGFNVKSGVAGSRDEEVRAGDHLLRIQVLHAGTRSEGRIGRLFIRGVERQGREVGESIDVATPSGSVRFTYLGQARPHLWSVSGWAASPLRPGENATP